MELKNMKGIIHIAIPCNNLDEAHSFYSTKLGAVVARRYEDRVTFNFFGHQVVCHLDDSFRNYPTSLYPFHIGFTFVDQLDYEAFHAHLKSNDVKFYMEMNERFKNLPEVHNTFVILDPSNNLLEFKHYKDNSFIY
ncbi:VOC family protein [Bdellovibrio reynosensis]|uniref:VOC family protein n=1 Tax=Bdellovibrio reynosensis TaxID=2835041 RepID=A0ABY4CBZ8_9BACT|nr:VOC family protein [Bdellovibrio reynosensis]UOF02244.1 VOC family protein [Bdellovibrio reynosensis]